MKQTVKVEGMSCGHCKARVEKALGGLNGVENFAVSLENGSADVEFNESAVSFDVIKEAIENLGFVVGK